MDKNQIAELCIRSTTPIREAIECIDRSGRISLALVIGDCDELLAVLTDGDIRRAILHGVCLEAPVSDLLPIKARMPNRAPVTAPVGTPRAVLLDLMRQKSVRQVPLVNRANQVVDIVVLRDLLPETRGDLQAVIMAGGFGKRLRPLTEDVPKPMLPVGGRPLMERIVGQLQQAGVRRVNITTHYKPEKIIEHFGDGAAFGMNISYVVERLPLGTGGALSLMPAPDSPVLVVNGDVLTGIDFRKMLEYHQEQKADMTVAVNLHTVNIPYGVVDSEDSRITRLREKPEIRFFVNAGIYLLEPRVYRHIPANQRFDMTELIQRLIDNGDTVISFPIREYWLDIGQPNDYQQAQRDLQREVSVKL